MGHTNFELMTQYTIEQLFDGKASNRLIVSELAHRWPDAKIQEISFVLIEAANAIDSWFAKGSPSREQSAMAYKFAALLSLDLYVMQSLGLPCDRAADLIPYWQAHDRYFLAQ